MEVLSKLFTSCNVSEVNKKVRTVGISGIFFLALIASVFVGFFNSNTLFAMPLCLMTAVYLSNRFFMINGDGKISFSLRDAVKFEKELRVRHLWLLALLGLMIGFAQGSWKMANLIDLIVITCCLMVILDVPESPEVYKPMLKIAAGFGMFYASSIWFQVFLPELYEKYLEMLTNGSGDIVGRFTSYYTGFTTSPGHTATYISIGLFAFAQELPTKKAGTIAAMVFLLVSLFYTGMRMPALAACLSLFCLIYFWTPREKRRKLTLILLGIGVVGVLSVILFQNQLREIPLINRTFTTIEKLLNGEDISSSRSKLYKHALSLFAQNPIFGIGWGNFRLTVVGVVTKVRQFEVHNIYLQLLCETGIVGFACFLIPMVYTLIHTILCYANAWQMTSDDLWTKLLGFSVMYQIYFLAFGMTDNTLFYASEQMPYFISCSILVAYLASKEKEGLRRAGK